MLRRCLLLPAGACSGAWPQGASCLQFSIDHSMHSCPGLLSLVVISCLLSQVLPLPELPLPLHPRARPAGAPACRALELRPAPVQGLAPGPHRLPPCRRRDARGGRGGGWWRGRVMAGWGGRKGGWVVGGGPSAAAAPLCKAWPFVSDPLTDLPNSSSWKHLTLFHPSGRLSCCSSGPAAGCTTACAWWPPPSWSRTCCCPGTGG